MTRALTGLLVLLGACGGGSSGAAADGSPVPADARADAASSGGADAPAGDAPRPDAGGAADAAPADAPRPDAGAAADAGVVAWGRPGLFQTVGGGTVSSATHRLRVSVGAPPPPGTASGPSGTIVVGPGAFHPSP